ncbi:acyl-CoA dehydrogenase family protein [Microbacterium sp.]|uniref:acyl-CoA dehydrogenase family protein n=1 Tax=Microbacterium sp. TaxID=51671 RepID=UPI0037C5E461
MTDSLADYRDFLARVLPDDYAHNHRAYRDDEQLRTRFQAESFDEGWLVPEWPQGLGGRDLPLTEALTIRIEGARRQVPRQMCIQATGVVAPALRTFGTPEQQDHYLRPTLRGEAWWALGMSEPEAGSDLASLRTTAVRRGDVFVVNGQKVWTTTADTARWCTLYVRTDTAAPKHKGITCLLLDMDTPGVEVRPIAMASPSLETFCEVFLDNVEVPVENVLGTVDQGWQVAMAALEHERDMIWINNWLETQRALEPVLAAGDLPPHRWERLGRLLADSEAIRLTGIRSVGHRSAGLDAPMSGILKLFGSESVQAAAAFTLDAASEVGIDSAGPFEEYLESMAATIYGGTSEVQRNIIAERILGLPRGA